MVISSIDRFRYFIPLGKRLKFDKCPNTHEEFIVNTMKMNLTNVDKKQLLRRRGIEFKNENKKFHCLRRMFYHPKIHILDVDKYITPEHTGVQLKEVCVYTTLDHTPESIILKNITVSAHKSEIIGMVGRTGAGKTTLLSVLQNIIENRTGQVLLDGKDLNDIPKVVIRQIVGVLPQIPFVFKGWTVRKFVDPRRLFTDEEINQALNKCGLTEFVRELPGGKLLDTILAPEERILYYNKKETPRPNTMEYKKPKSSRIAKAGDDNDLMIVVDEPPVQDPDTAITRKDDLQVPIYELLKKHFSHCTTFVTAHDVSVLKSCTSVWVVHHGRLVKTCKASDVSANESIASIIEQNVKRS
ncbi:hypothetical protein MACK_004132 [Theileria orientalis]|uniref:ABC transporter domain-containing protein n=1 Tax=Theileria orientalis TaxID=68886 RepID=A0A976SK19_THEOR|nr:hypothetical protein MACK_004132 [Theileria orientalis]